MSLPGRILKYYTKFLSRYPLTTQSIQAGILMGTGDIIAQTVVEKRELTQINLTRTAPYAAAGLIVGPTVATWYKFLDYMFGTGKAGITAVLKKMIMDQSLFAPCFLATLVSSLHYSKGHSVTEVKEHLHDKYIDILLANYKVWPFVQLVNFYFLPLQYRVLFVQCVSVVWNTYLSWKINHSKSIEKTEAALF